MKFTATTKIGGDETRGYDVTDYKATTVGEFVGEVLSGNGKKEWGDFRIIKENGDCNKPSYCWNKSNYYKYEYKRGELLETIPYDVFKSRIKNVTADGGWSRMDYRITIVEENEKENKSGIGIDTLSASINDNEKIPIEKAREIAHEYFRKGQLGFVSPDTESAGYDCAMQMYEWCKEDLLKEYRKELNEIYKHYIIVQKLLMIDKVCEWIKEHNGDYISIVPNDHLTNDFYDDLRKVMKGE